MSLFSCLGILSDLKALHCDDVDLCRILDDIKKRINLAESQDNSLALLPIIADIKACFKNAANLSYFSPTMWLPFEPFYFTQKMNRVITELDACVQAGRWPNTGNMTAFQLPSIKAPRFCIADLQPYYDLLNQELNTFYNQTNTSYLHAQWQKFNKKTLAQKTVLMDAPTSWWQAYHLNQYFEVRQGVHNQIAFAYLFQKHQQASMNYEADWRQGSSKQSGYGYVMSMALPLHDPAKGIKGNYTLNRKSAKFERHRYNQTKDQAEIKHNRLTTLRVASTVDRGKALLDLAKKNKGKHLNIKLLSRVMEERYTYLQHTKDKNKPGLIFCDPKYGVFHFDNDDDFLFFYQMLYAKEQMQTDLCWNRYQVSHMRYEPKKAQLSTWPGKLRSVFSGLKYTTSLWDRVKNFVLFNTTLFLCLTAGYMISGAVSVISPFLGALLLMVFAKNSASMILSGAFTLGSSGVFSAIDFIHALCLTISDQLKWLFGIRPHFDAVLHAPFDLHSNHSVAGASHIHLMKHFPQTKVPAENTVNEKLSDKDAVSQSQPDVSLPLVNSVALKESRSLSF